ncbi:MAG: hypothetical protein WC795_00875 [Candidatus Paceibacterota bacterium]|jgi:hypothetical protein
MKKDLKDYYDSYPKGFLSLAEEDEIRKNDLRLKSKSSIEIVILVEKSINNIFVILRNPSIVFKKTEKEKHEIITMNKRARMKRCGKKTTAKVAIILILLKQEEQYINSSPKIRRVTKGKFGTLISTLMNDLIIPSKDGKKDGIINFKNGLSSLLEKNFPPENFYTENLSVNKNEYSSCENLNLGIFG